MIQLDDRTGSRELEPLLRNLGVPVVLGRMDYGDASFIGNGPDGEGTVLVGVERKTISDLVQCLKDGRLTGHQIPGLLANYQSVWLVVEGIWREGDDGVLEVYRGAKRWDEMKWNRIMAGEVRRFLTSLRVQAGVEVINTSSTQDTCRSIRDLHAWWSKPWHEHHSIVQKHKPMRANVWGIKPSVTQLMLEQIPGIGEDKAKAAAEHFGTMTAAVEADIGAWCLVPGIGKKLAEKCHAAMRRKG